VVLGFQGESRLERW